MLKADNPNLDNYFINLCNTIASIANDKSTKVGCVIVNQDNLVLSTGVNDFPNGVLDKEERHSRPAKYLWKECCERNAIFNAAKVGISLQNSKIYSQFLACPHCARAIIQSGIKEVIYHKEFTNATKSNPTQDINKLNSKDNTDIALQMLSEGGVVVRAVSVKLEYNKPFKSGDFLNI